MRIVIRTEFPIINVSHGTGPRIKFETFLFIDWVDCFCALLHDFIRTNGIIFLNLLRKMHTIIRKKKSNYTTMHTQQWNRWQHTIKWSLWAPVVWRIIRCFSLTCACVCVCFGFLRVGSFILSHCIVRLLYGRTSFCSNVSKVIYLFYADMKYTDKCTCSVVILRVCGNCFFFFLSFCGIGNNQNWARGAVGSVVW